MSLKDRYAIVGVGKTKQGKVPGVSGLNLNILAIKAALDDAGLRVKDVDCLFVKTATGRYEAAYTHTVAAKLGIEPVVACSVEQMGSSPIGMIQYAMNAIEAGMCEVAVMSYGDNPATGTSPYGTFVMESGMWGVFAPATMYAFIAQRHMHEYGTTSRQLGALAVTLHKNGSINPEAAMQKVITVEDHQNSRLISAPLRLFDCALVTDGGSAIVMTSAKRARELKKPPVYIMGFGQHHRTADVQYRTDITVTPARRSSEIAYKMAGVTPKDIDVACLYDCFTITLLTTIEDYGFCKKGEGGPFVESGAVALGGQIPVNPSGGMLSESGMPGFMQFVEATRQLRGECGNRQIKDAEIGVVSQQGGVMHAHGTVILRR